MCVCVYAGVYVFVYVCACVRTVHAIAELTTGRAVAVGVCSVGKTETGNEKRRRWGGKENERE